MKKIAISMRYTVDTNKKVFRESYGVSSYFLRIAKELDWFLIPVTEDLPAEEVSSFGGLILPGSPNSAYSEDIGDIRLVNAFLAEDKHVLGICGGMQCLNVMRGGSLKEVDEHYDVRHAISMLYSNNAVCKSRNVNSFHYYACDEIGDGFSVFARSEDGTPEGIISSSGLLLGVQWHPEADYDLDLFRGWLKC